MTAPSRHPVRAGPVLLAAMLLPSLPALAAAEGAVTGALSWGVALAALGLSAWAGRAARRQHGRARDLAARNARLGAAARAARDLADRAEAKARRLNGALAAMSDGVSLVDGDHRLVGWNPRFPGLAGVPRGRLRIGMPFGEVLRLQAEAGEFGLVDPKAEVARRMALLRNGPALDRWPRQRPDGALPELRRAPLPGGGFVTLYAPRPPGGLSTRDASLDEAFRREWSARIGRLTAAAADADLPGARAAAHALRGVATNAGWVGAAATLATLEVSPRAGDLEEARAIAATLALDPPW